MPQPRQQQGESADQFHNRQNNWIVLGDTPHNQDIAVIREIQARQRNQAGLFQANLPPMPAAGNLWQQFGPEANWNFPIPAPPPQELLPTGHDELAKSVAASATAPIHELLGLNRVININKDVHLASKIEKYCNYFGIIDKYNDTRFPKPVIQTDALVGFEVEVEGSGIERATRLEIPYWGVHTDGSLRNGYEFVSVPLPYNHIAKAIWILNETLSSIAKAKCDYSWRTSLHVHCNVQDLNTSQLLNLVKLYMVFEPLLFQFCGGQRDDSNFCVPLYKSDMDAVYQKYLPVIKSHGYASFLISLTQHWQKYTALNLVRVGDLGTVEYRHMPGGFDLERTLDWASIISCLYNAAVKMTDKEINDYILTLNTNSNYMQFRDVIFGQAVGDKLPIGNFDRLLSRGVTYAKDCFFVPAKQIQKDAKVDRDSLIYKYISHHTQQETQKKVAKEQRREGGF